MSELVDPLVSFVIPLLNRKNLVSKTLEAVINQTYTNWEAIIVDDGSTDGSLEYLIEHYSDERRIKIFSRPSDRTKGAPSSRNFGIENVKGSYIIFLDSDDLLAPYCLERRVSSFKENLDQDFLVFPVLCFDWTPGDSAKLWNVDKEKSDLSRMLDLDVPFITFSSIWKKESIDRLGKWDERLTCWQDYDYYIRALISGFLWKKIQSEPDAFYRRGNADKITQGKKSVKQLNSIAQICENVYNYFKEHNALNSQNKTKIYELYISVCIKFLNIQHFEGIEKIIKDLKRLKLIGLSQALKLSIIFKISILIRRNARKNLLWKFLYKVWYLGIYPYLKKFPPRDNTCQKISVDDAFVAKVPSLLSFLG